MCLHCCVLLQILDDSRKWWKARNWRGQMAHVPHTIVTPFHYGNPGNSSDHNDIFNNPLYSRNRRVSIITFQCIRMLYLIDVMLRIRHWKHLAEV